MANIAVGYNNFDLDACTRHGICATNTPDVLNEATADHAWALLLAAARRVTESERWLRAGLWKRWTFEMFLGAEISGTTLGIVGMGRIGRAIARRAAGFRMPVIYHNRTRLSPDAEDGAAYVDFAELLREADHVVLVVPYSPAVHHMIDAAALAQMKPGAVLVNIARGGVVDDAALVAALRAGRIGAAGLDVFENEPSLHPGLLELENVVLTPHIASSTRATRAAMADAGDPQSARGAARRNAAIAAEPRRAAQSTALSSRRNRTRMPDITHDQAPLAANGAGARTGAAGRGRSCGRVSISAVSGSATHCTFVAPECRARCVSPNRRSTSRSRSVFC